jgi:hypothetical protein
MNLGIGNSGPNRGELSTTICCHGDYGFRR